MKRIAILGCGPAGLLAAHAANLMGHSVTIYSKKQRSKMLGAQYMHRPIPELRLDPPVKLAYVLHGTIAGYREKIYGENEEVTVSPSLFAGYHEAWSIRQAYHLLWDRYRSIIIDGKVTSDLMLHIHDNFDAILSTVPAPLLCYNRQYHVFNSVRVFIDGLWHGGDPALNHERYGSEHLVICNGIPYDSEFARMTGWYRTSLIYGHANTEWIANSDMPADVVAVTKPISTNCNCWPTVVRAGRYGEWRKGVLSHEAFEAALEAFA